MRPPYLRARALASLLALALLSPAPAQAYPFGQSVPGSHQAPQWALDVLRGMREPAHRAAAPASQGRKLDANGIGCYSDVRVTALERRADLICAALGRGHELVVAGCMPASEAYRLADSLLSQRPLRVYLDHTKRYAPVQTQETFRITQLQP
ncbi:toxin [Bordetella genomosp. 12]|uniref:Toxin n=1 Tax=Bordetella genomosp. 12 TaxID=463035 RepID=A0A261VLY4_9BORD|nr:toxin [Bordetella genomosp. 12]OZI75148.1 toxin [Bordetella genomosp. 12]